MHASNYRTSKHVYQVFGNNKGNVCVHPLPVHHMAEACLGTGLGPGPALGGPCAWLSELVDLIFSECLVERRTNDQIKYRETVKYPTKTDVCVAAITSAIVLAPSLPFVLLIYNLRALLLLQKQHHHPEKKQMSC